MEEKGASTLIKIKGLDLIIGNQPPGRGKILILQ